MEDSQLQKVLPDFFFLRLDKNLISTSSETRDYHTSGGKRDKWLAPEIGGSVKEVRDDAKVSYFPQ